MDKKIDSFIDDIVNDHHQKVEDVTKEQLKDIIVGLINSGDIMTHVMPMQFQPQPFKSFSMTQKQGMSYTPYREKLRLEQKIRELEEGWIDVEDRLPKRKDQNNDWVDVDMYADDGVWAGYYDVLCESFHWEDDCSSMENGKFSRVTHWRERPAPPMSES